MKRQIIVFLCVLWAGHSLLAAEFLPALKVGDSYYSNVTVLNVTTTDILISSRKGIGNVKLKNLDSEWQKHFNFDPAKAAEAEEKQVGANAQYTQIMEQQAAQQAAHLAAQKSAEQAAFAAARAKAKAAMVVFPDTWTMDGKPEIRAAHASIEGKPMPALDVSDWVNGQPQAQDLRGKVVILDFFASWCGPCMRAIPHNNDLFAKYKDKGVAVIGICTSDRGQEFMNQVVQQQSIQYPTADDPMLAAQNAWQIHYYPTYAIVDQKGILRKIGLRPECLEYAVKALLKEQSL